MLQVSVLRLHLGHSLFSNFKSLITLLTISILLSSCGAGGGTPEINPDGTEVEVLRIGSGSGAGFTAGILSASDTNLNAGESSTIQVNVVNQNNTPPTGAFSLTYSSICVSSGLANLEAPVSMTTGLITFVYNADGCSGSDTITVTLTETGDTATLNITVQPPEVLTVSFISSDSSQLSLAGIGGTETTELTFKVESPQGAPIIGETVSFSLNNSVGGSTILPGKETDTTDNNGQVSTILKTGTVAGPVKVIATHDASGIDGDSGDIIISTGIPIFSRFSLSFSQFNPPNAFDTDGVEVTLSIISSDQFGNSAPDGTPISFVAPESGNVEASCLLTGGGCSVTWRSTSPRPADGRLEIIAYTIGAEDFIDNNGNSVFDGSDGAILDLTEPYADHNENSIYDLGEFFYDTDNSGTWSLGNNLWDGPCLIQTDASAICTGNSSTIIFKTGTIVLSTNTPRALGLGTFPALNNTITVTQNDTASFSGLQLADDNLAGAANPLPIGTTAVFSIQGDGATVQGIDSYTIANTSSPLNSLSIEVAAAEVAPTDTLPTGVSLQLLITTPNSTASAFNWPIDIIR